MKSNQTSGYQKSQELSKKSKENQYETAREHLLAKVVPDEEENAPTCMWKLCCCFYYLFCCCFCEQSKQVTKHMFRQRFGRWLNLEKLTRGRDKKMSVVKNLMRLYAHQSEAIRDLEKSRVNPDFNSPFRDDLEFFIPQICSFYLKGEFENLADLSNLIVLASSTSFFFSHRVWFFFQSTMYQDFNEDIYKKSQKILKGLKTVCLENKEKIYLANSKDILNLIVDLNLVEFWPTLKFDKQLLKREYTSNNMQLQNEIEKNQQLDKFIQVQSIIRNYDTGTEEPSNLENGQSPLRFKKISCVSIDNQGNEITLCAKDIILQPFVFSLDEYDDHTMQFNQQEMNEDKRLKLQAFLSTPKFIKCLTDISYSLSKTKATKEEKYKILQEELKKINQNLPASVYIPFVGNSIRNYAVLHIDINECRVFQTKERSPVMIAIELYRPDELNLYSNKKSSNNILSFKSNDDQESFDLDDPENYDSENPYMRDIRQKQREEREKKKHGFKFSSLKSIRNRSNSQKKSTKEDQHRRNSLKEEEGNISKMADSRVSNAIVINQFKQKDQLIRRVMDNDDIDYMSRHDSRMRKSSVQEESSEMAFDMESQHQIEMTTPQSNTIEIQNNSNRPTVQGQGSQQPAIKKKGSNHDLQDQTFENFYSKYRTLSADSSSLQMYSQQIMQRRQEKKAQQLLEQQQQQQQEPSTQQPQINPSSANLQNRIPEEDDHQFSGVLQKVTPINSINGSLFYSANANNNQNYQINADDRVINLPDSDDSSDSSDSSSNSSSSSDDEVEEEKDEDSPKEHLLLYEEGDVNNALRNQESIGKSSRKTQNKNMLIQETSEEQEHRIRMHSPFGYLKSWKLFRFIVKANDDVRQEQFAMQLISEIQQIFKIKKLPLWLKAYEILATGPNCGLIDYINDAMSIDEIHKKTDNKSLYEFYVQSFGKGKKKSKGFKKAQRAFCYSLAAYSLVCYILQIKDRHNQNIMIDNEGHIIHIDYGFLLSNAPGKGLKIERAPFKLTQEFVNVLRGTKNKKFILFRNLMKMGFMALQEHADKVIILVEMMMISEKDLHCFQDRENTVKTLKERFFPTGKRMNETEAAQFIDLLITQSYGNWRTIMYDKIQYCCQGIV